MKMRPLAAILAAFTFLAASAVVASTGEYGYAAKRPIIAGACKQCVWGPLSEFVRAAMKPEGYDVQVCYNCNRADSPRFVAEARVPPDLSEEDKAVGSPPPPKGKVDFGVTEAQMLVWNYNGVRLYKGDGPQRHLRLVAKIEDPVYFLIAAKKSSGITDLAKLKDEKRPIRILTEGGDFVEPVLKYYGLTEEAVRSWGGSIDNGAMHPNKSDDFDLIVSSLGGIGNNLESNVWATMSEKFDLMYFPLPDDLRATLVREFDGTKVDLPIQFLRGVERPLATVGRSGHVIYGRADMPDDFAYALAKAVNENRDRLKWLNRPYSYDSRTVWKDGNVPLHPGAARYYREVGYMK